MPVASHPGYGTVGGELGLSGPDASGEIHNSSVTLLCFRWTTTKVFERLETLVIPGLLVFIYACPFEVIDGGGISTFNKSTIRHDLGLACATRVDWIPSDIPSTSRRVGIANLHCDEGGIISAWGFGDRSILGNIRKHVISTLKSVVTGPRYDSVEDGYCVSDIPQIRPYFIPIIYSITNNISPTLVLADPNLAAILYLTSMSFTSQNWSSLFSGFSDATEQ